ncbi:IclR family transcriptional regulator [Amycolatopsis sp. DSM 110486]|uniref:IclR family transcriptional regulator n=1 Tax=Amycolatopsis sp. DSM 110486 TaxID=2865832 RepID=UPI001C6A4435|nr:IclR family transcriptional regulator [Amycolatopsis sp. DSM 110486]QYN17022.1 IclR family transcriptional regulator [Amycolatopsis sp. DSM 110486]
MAAREPEDDRQGIQSVEIAMTVVRALEQGPGPMSLKQVAEASGMAPSKVHRYLVSLSREGLVAQSPNSGRYDLGPALRRLGMEALRRMDEVEVVSEHLPGLRDRTGHSVNLAVWGDHGPVIVGWHYGSHVLPITVRVGAILPLMSTSVGRVFLAHLPETITAPVLRGDFDPGAAPEVPSPAQLTRVIRDVRRSGAAVTTDAMIPGVTTVAAPVFSEATPLPLAVALAMPVGHASPEQVASATEELLRTTTAASAELGGRGPAAG